MGEIDVDRESRAAADALVWRLKHRGDTDDEVLALEFITALRGQGWRPTLARPAPDWHYRGGGEISSLPDAGQSGGSAYLAAKAARGWAPPAGDEP